MSSLFNLQIWFKEIWRAKVVLNWTKLVMHHILEPVFGLVFYFLELFWFSWEWEDKFRSIFFSEWSACLLTNSSKIVQHYWTTHDERSTQHPTQVFLFSNQQMSAYLSWDVFDINRSTVLRSRLAKATIQAPNWATFGDLPQLASMFSPIEINGKNKLWATFHHWLLLLLLVFSPIETDG